MCVSNSSPLRNDRVVRVLRVKGAKAVRYGSDWEASCRANGFVGSGDNSRFGRGILAENGSKVARRDDIDFGAVLGTGRLVRFASSDVSKDLETISSFQAEVTSGTHRNWSSPLVSLFKSGSDSIFFAHASSSSTSFLSRRKSAALFSRELRFSRTAAETPPRSEAVSKPSGGGDWKFTALSGLSCNALAVRRFARFSCRLLGLLLNSPLGRSGAFSRPNCVGVGGRSGSRISSSMRLESGPISISASFVALPNSNAN